MANHDLVAGSRMAREHAMDPAGKCVARDAVCNLLHGEAGRVNLVRY